ncbi:IclR family transcriptional regulator [Microcella humidisoli]|uniref:IclR family transcriptional regulator n=1 Tax=Microcella humidisoli TaxID=2963406 RepID=A0ABY5FSU4_9MICO|nr:IclR family transcriptional regulator [Microcella humidisoli]UTT61358.1 IclR family transcriptional regulator [Microcella humidisoli]
MPVPDVPAARAALRIVTHLAHHSDPVPASTLARELELPRSSVYQLLRVLQDEGFVVHYPEARAYGLGALVAEIGGSVLSASRLARLGGPLLERLVRAAPVPVVAQLAVLAGSDVSYVGQVAAPRAPTTVVRVGVRLPAHLTATGRAMLAALPAAQVRALFPHREALITRRGVGPRTLPELDRILLAARDAGVATEDGDITAGYASVAATGIDRTGYPAAALGLTYRAEAVTAEQVDALADAVREAAGALSARLQGRA